MECNVDCKTVDRSTFKYEGLSRFIQNAGHANKTTNDCSQLLNELEMYWNVIYNIFLYF